MQQQIITLGNDDVMMMQYYFPYLYIIDARNHYPTEIYAINAILMEIDIYTSQRCQINIYIGYYFASKIKVVPNDARCLIINIFVKQLNQIAQTWIMLVALHEVGNMP